MSASARGVVLAALARLFWMLVGPVALILLATAIARTGNGWATPFDIAFLLVIAALVGGRWLEFAGGQPQTAAGEPADWTHFRRYAVGVVVLGLAVWVGSNLVGNHLLPL